jgi:hypothetical protein
MGNKVTDIYAAIFVAISLIIFSTLYIFATFSYKISENSIVMQWRILGCVPFATREIRTENIQEVRRFELKDLFSGVHVFGNLVTTKGVILVLKKRIIFVKKIFITPDNPDGFVQQLGKQISNPEHSVEATGIQSRNS